MFGISVSPYVRHEQAVRFFGTAGPRLYVATGIALSLVAGFATVGGIYIERYTNTAYGLATGAALDPQAAAAALERAPDLNRLPIVEPAVSADTNRRGLGVRIGSDAHILTSRHVVHACPRLVVIDADGLPHHAALVAEDRNNDLAAIRSETVPPSVGIALRAFPPPAFNEEIWHIRPATFRRNQKETIVGVARIADLARRSDSRLVTLISDQRGNGPAFVGGDSGGPVTDTDGELLGIVAGTLPSSRAHATEFAQNIGFMVNIGLIEMFLQANGIDYTNAHDEPADPPRSPGDVLKHTVIVHCDRKGQSLPVGNAITDGSPRAAG